MTNNQEKRNDEAFADIPSQRLLPHQKLYVAMAVVVLLLFSLVSLQKMNDRFGENLVGFAAAGQSVTQEDLNNEFQFRNEGAQPSEAQPREGSFTSYGGKTYYFRGGKWNIPKAPAPARPAASAAPRNERSADKARRLGQEYLTKLGACGADTNCRNKAYTDARDKCGVDNACKGLFVEQFRSVAVGPAGAPPTTPAPGAAPSPAKPKLVPLRYGTDPATGEELLFHVDAQGNIYMADKQPANPNGPALLLKNTPAYTAAVRQARGESTGQHRVTAPPPPSPAAQQGFDTAQQEYFTAAHEATQASKRILELNGRLRAAEEKLAEQRVPANLDALNNLKAEYARLMPEFTKQKQQAMQRLEQADAARAVAEQALRGIPAPTPAPAVVAASPAPAQIFSSVSKFCLTYPEKCTGNDGSDSIELQKFNQNPANYERAYSAQYSTLSVQPEPVGPPEPTPEERATAARAPSAQPEENFEPRDVSELPPNVPSGSRQLGESGFYLTPSKTIVSVGGDEVRPAVAAQLRSAYASQIGGASVEQQPFVAGEPAGGVLPAAPRGGESVGGAEAERAGRFTPEFERGGIPERESNIPAGPRQVTGDKIRVGQRDFIIDSQGNLFFDDPDPAKRQPVPARVAENIQKTPAYNDVIDARIAAAELVAKAPEPGAAVASASPARGPVRTVKIGLINGVEVHRGSDGFFYDRQGKPITDPAIGRKAAEIFKQKRESLLAEEEQALALLEKPKPGESPQFDFTEEEAEEARAFAAAEAEALPAGAAGPQEREPAPPRPVSVPGINAPPVMPPLTDQQSAQRATEISNYCRGQGIDTATCIQRAQTGSDCGTNQNCVNTLSRLLTSSAPPAVPAPPSAGAPAPAAMPGAAPSASVPAAAPPDLNALVAQRNARLDAHRRTITRSDDAALRSIAQNTGNDPELREAAASLLAERGQTPPPVQQPFVPPAQTPQPIRNADEAIARANEVLAFCADNGFDADACKKVADYSCVNNPACNQMVQRNLQPLARAQAQAVAPAPAGARPAGAPQGAGAPVASRESYLVGTGAFSDEQKAKAACERDHGAGNCQREQTAGGTVSFVSTASPRAPPRPVIATTTTPPDCGRSADCTITSMLLGPNARADSTQIPVSVMVNGVVHEPFFNSATNEWDYCAGEGCAAQPNPKHAPIGGNAQIEVLGEPVASAAAPAPPAPGAVPPTPPPPAPVPPTPPPAEGKQLAELFKPEKPEKTASPPSSIDELKKQFSVTCDEKTKICSNSAGEVKVSEDGLVLFDGTAFVLHAGGGLEMQVNGRVQSFKAKDGTTYDLGSLGVKEVTTNADGSIASVTFERPRSCTNAILLTLCTGGETSAAYDAKANAFKLDDGTTIQLQEGGLALAKNPDGSTSLMASGADGKPEVLTTVGADVSARLEDGKLLVSSKDGKLLQQINTADPQNVVILNFAGDGKTISSRSRIDPALGRVFDEYDADEKTFSTYCNGGALCAFGVGCDAKTGTCKNEGRLQSRTGGQCTIQTIGGCQILDKDGKQVSIDDFCKTSGMSAADCKKKVAAAGTPAMSFFDAVGLANEGVQMANDVRNFCDLVADKNDCDGIFGDIFGAEEFLNKLKKEDPVLAGLFTGDWEESMCWKYLDRSNAEQGQEGFLYDLDSQLKLWIAAEKAPMPVPIEEGGLRNQQGMYYRINGEINPTKICQIDNPPPAENPSRADIEKAYKNEFLVFTVWLVGRNGQTQIDPQKDGNPENDVFSPRCDSSGVTLIGQQTIVRVLPTAYDEVCIKFHNPAKLQSFVRDELAGGMFCNTIVPSSPEISQTTTPSGGVPTDATGQALGQIPEIRN